MTGIETSHKEIVFAAGLEGVSEGNQIEVEKLILDTLNNLLKDGVLTQEEFEKAKKKLLDN